jgi:ABC-type Mn2+/Zn2+ transport system permease subunit
MIDFLLEPLEYEFFRHGLLAALMVGSFCGLIGASVILRGMSYVGNGLSHAAFGAAVVGFMLNLNFYAGTGGNGLAGCAIDQPHHKKRQNKTGRRNRYCNHRNLCLGCRHHQPHSHLQPEFRGSLFGNILGITSGNLLVIELVSGSTVLAIFFMYRPLLVSTFDHDAA